MTYPKTTLGDIAEFINGVAFKPSDWSERGRRIIRIQNLTNSEKPYNLTERIVDSKYLVNQGDILVSWSASLGVFQWNMPEQAVVNQHIFRVILDSELVDKRYLFHVLQDSLSQMKKHLHGATMKHINRGEFLATQIPLPTLNEQKRIGAVLDKTYALRRLRFQSIDLTEKLLRSVFLDMFVQSEAVKEWPKKTIKECAENRKGSLRTGPFGSQLKHSEFVEKGIAVLGIDNAVNNEFREGKARFISEEKYQGLKRYRVYPGDVIITIMGTVGRCAIVPSDIPLAINTKHLCCITLDQDLCLPEYLHACFINHPGVLEQLGVRTKGAVMPGLNMGIIKELEIPTAPINLQQEFKKKTKALRDHLVFLIRSKESLDKFFSSIQQRAFNGDLDLSNLILDEEAEDFIETANELDNFVNETLWSSVSPNAIEPSAAIEKKLKILDKFIENDDQISWSLDYFKYRLFAKQSTNISITDLISQAERVFKEPNYDAIRDMLFDCLNPTPDKPMLIQTFDDERKEIVLQFA